MIGGRPLPEREQQVVSGIHFLKDLQGNFLVPFDGAADSNRAVSTADRVFEPEVSKATQRIVAHARWTVVFFIRGVHSL